MLAIGSAFVITMTVGTAVSGMGLPARRQRTKPENANRLKLGACLSFNNPNQAVSCPEIFEN
jgi:hypothetical protein